MRIIAIVGAVILWSIITMFAGLAISTYLELKTARDTRNHSVRFWRFILGLPHPWGPDDHTGFDDTFPMAVMTLTLAIMFTWVATWPD